MVQKNCLNKIIIICGCTGSGKTALAVECAKLLNSEVISADSMYIYKKLNIGTAKPTIEEMQGIKHHLIDVCAPQDYFTVNDYKNLAEPIIQDLISKGKIPIICGGTGFYINSILYNLSYGKGMGNPEIREKYFNLAKEKGNSYIYNILNEVDEESAKKLHPNDLKRVIRALEIYSNGTKKSDIKDDLSPNYNYRAYCVDFSREELYDRINLRVDKMIEKGLINEVKELMSTVNRNCQSMQGIGYKEIISYLNKEMSLEEAIELIKLNTRHYAKRQITFFKKLDKLNHLENTNIYNMAKGIVNNL